MSFGYSVLGFGAHTSIDYDPTTVSGLNVWYDSSDISTLWTTSARSVQVSALDDPVGAWDDKSGNGYHLLQPTAGYRPTYKTTSGIYFNAANTEYLFDSTTRASVNFDGNYFVVFNHASGTSGTGFAITYTGNIYNYCGIDGRHPTVGEYAYFRTRSSGTGYNHSIQTNADFDDGANHVASLQLDNVDAEVWNDGLTQGTDTNWIGDTVSPNRTAIGALIRTTTGAYLTGYVMEALYYDSVLSDADRQYIENGLIAKWSI